MTDILHQVDKDTIEQLKLKEAPAVSDREDAWTASSMWIRAVIAGCSGGTYQNLMRVC